MIDPSLPFFSYQDSLQRIISDKNLHISERNNALFSLFSSIIEEITSTFDVHFTTLFSRLSFFISQNDISKFHSFFFHRYRNLNENRIDPEYAEDVTLLGIALIDSLIDISEGREPSFSFSSDAPIFESSRKNTVGTVDFIKVLIFEIDTKNKILLAYEDEYAHEPITIKYDVSDRNELFTSDIEKGVQLFGTPLIVNFIDVTIDEDGIYTPSSIVLDPDYLINVTRIAGTFVNRKIEGTLSLTKRFVSIDNSKKPLLVGNIANMFFDEILKNPDIDFKEILPKIFSLSPLSLALYDDKSILELVRDVRSHFFHLKEVVNNQLKRVNISRDKVYLEPTFYSSQYGLQGRLDLLHHNGDEFDIVELKSGSPFRPNKYGLSEQHYIQTILYDMMISTAFGPKKVRRPYILYSKEKTNTLRYAPSIQTKQIEAMHARNKLVLLDFYMSLGSSEALQVLKSLRVDNYAHIKGFERKNVEVIEKMLTNADPVFLAYIGSFTSFIAREQRLAKVGEHGLYKDNGLAGLWLEVDAEKEARFSLLKKLEITAINDVYFSLKRSSMTATLADFREGDIAVFYPYSESPSAVLENQIFKCSIVEIGDDIKVKLKSNQYNKKIFEENKYWNIESDMMDSAFNVMFRSILSMAQLSQEKKDLLLGRRKPRHSFKEYIADSSLSKQQNDLVQQIVNADDYFLLWGPPGTGKTSVMIKKLAHHMFANEKKPFLLLAYTNKAVDEICEAISGLDYIRIGSENSCGVGYRSRLLSNLSKDIQTRTGIIDLLDGHNIFVGTVSSMISAQELFKIKDFGTVIIDEASQILEPLMVGILSKVDRFILVGDHKQLPAVVKQKTEQAKIFDEALLNVGFSDMKMSFFERLYKQNKTNDWIGSFGILTYQGRMHESLMQFVNKKNYGGQLAVFDGVPRLKASSFLNPGFELSDRQIFIHTEVDNNVNWKTNEYEALKTASLIQKIYEQYRREHKPFTPNSIGVIAPYRAHIAMLDKQLKILCPDIYHFVSIDTVERYQGGARDIIILSLCTNNERQFETLISLSDEGVDRKLNVALTRCKEQIIIVGNYDIICSNPTYKELIDGYTRVDA